MDLAQALAAFPQLVEQHQAATARLEAVERELAALKDDRYVDWDWICDYFDIRKPTARLMLADVQMFAYGKQIKRFKKSDILRFAQRNSLKVKDDTL